MRLNVLQNTIVILFHRWIVSISSWSLSALVSCCAPLFAPPWERSSRILLFCNAHRLIYCQTGQNWHFTHCAAEKLHFISKSNRRSITNRIYLLTLNLSFCSIFWADMAPRGRSPSNFPFLDCCVQLVFVGFWKATSFSFSWVCDS
jgi:hypothetical protein